MEFSESKNVFQSKRLLKNDRFWQVFVRLVDKKRDEDDPLMKVSEYPMKKEYAAENTEPPLSVAEVWTEYGLVDGKHIVSEPSYRPTVKRALILANHKLENKITQGYGESNEDPCTSRHLPMLAQKYKHVDYPVMVQPKLDGTRMMAYLEGKHVILYSRQLKTVEGKQNIRKHLKKILRPGMYLDGEFYEHGESLQKLSSWFRTDSNEGQYWVFDVFFPCSSPEMKFKDRYAVLEHLIKPNKTIQLVRAQVVKSDVDKILDVYRSKGYEGAIVRDMNAPYEPGKRSYGVQKLKTTETGEYVVVGIEAGQAGKSRGALVLVLETPEGKRFKSVPTDTLEWRKQEYKKLSKRNTLLGKRVTVEFEDLSEDSVPLRSKVVGLRPYL